MNRHGWYQNIRRGHLFGLFINGEFIGELNNQAQPGYREGNIVFIEPKFPVNFSYNKLQTTTESYIPCPEVENVLKPYTVQPPYFMSYKNIGPTAYDYDPQDYPGLRIPITVPFIESQKAPASASTELFLDIEQPIPKAKDWQPLNLDNFQAVKVGTFPWAIQQLLEGRWVTRRSARVPYFTDRDTYSWYLRPIERGNDLLPSGCRYDDLNATDWIIINPVDTFMA